MQRRAERTSPCGPALAVLGLALLACAVAPAAADPPTNAWGSGIALPGTIDHQVQIVSDGGAGVLAVVTQVNEGFVFTSNVRLYHVLEQGRLDPSLPPTGAILIAGADVPNNRDNLEVGRVRSDGAGGAYVLVRACNTHLAHQRCWEQSEMRLLHVDGQGATVPGWPALGVVLNAMQWLGIISRCDITSDGGSGVVAAWVDGTQANYFAPAVFAQHFSFAGATLWPGGVAGQQVLAPKGQRGDLVLAGDGTGGLAVVVQELITTVTPYRAELAAGRMDAAGNSPWGTAGKPVVLQSSSAVAQSVQLDGLGQTFISLTLAPNSAAQQFLTQKLTPLGAKAWGAFGKSLGSFGGGPTYGVLTDLGFVTMHFGAADYLLQLQEDGGGFVWAGGYPEGEPAAWASPPTPQRPVPMPDGHVVCVFGTGSDPATATRALELDENGEPLPDWPDTGAVVCCGDFGNYFADAFTAQAQLFVALASSEQTPALVKVQRLSRAVLGVPRPQPHAALELAPPSPNPARAEWSVRFALADESDVTLEAFDVAGRRVLDSDLGRFPPGAHVVPVADGRALAPGVYRVRLRAGPHAAERVLVRMR